MIMSMTTAAMMAPVTVNQTSMSERPSSGVVAGGRGGWVTLMNGSVTGCLVTGTSTGVGEEGWNVVAKVRKMMFCVEVISEAVSFEAVSFEVL